MLFNSPEFIFIFLPITLLVSYICANYSRVWAEFSLIIASLAFYAYFSVNLLALLIVSIIVNYGLGKLLVNTRTPPDQRKVLLSLGVMANILVLLYFKYTNFLIDNVNILFGSSYALQNIILPLGISFFTFQKIAYLVDSYRGNAERYDFLGFSLFVMYFPQLIAGPIVHHNQIIPQFKKINAFKYTNVNFCAGIVLFIIGLGKKILYADSCAQISDPLFLAVHNGSALSIMDSWAAALAFTFQIYYDFSGYTDMALGLAVMSGIKLPSNFNSPYKSTNIREFWRRWHITLSKFIRDYIYIPIGGSKHGLVRKILNLEFAMLIGGLWHGAAWTFIVWGGLHGLYLSISHYFEYIKARFSNQYTIRNMKPKIINIITTFFLVVIGWIYFRSETISAANKMVISLVGIGNDNLTTQTSSYEMLLIGYLLIVSFFFPNSQQLMSKYHVTLDHVVSSGPSSIMSFFKYIKVLDSDGVVRINAITGCLFATTLLGLLTYQAYKSVVLVPFIYFQF